MMPFTPRRDSRCQPSRPPKCAGFTLTEMLVVIGIIVLVLSIATPMVTRAWRAGDRARTAADLAAIATALEAYKTDHGDYPRVGAEPFAGATLKDFNGARMLCRALIAPGPETSSKPEDIADGKGADVASTGGGTAGTPSPGPGFRTRGTSGPVFGPYLPPDRFKMGDASGQGQTALGYLALLDRYNRPILYYPANGRPNVRMDLGLVGEWNYEKRASAKIPMYNVADNAAFPMAQIAPMLGDLTANGKIDSGEQPATDKPYLLWSAGPDETFGPDISTMNRSDLTGVAKTAEAVRKSDDVTNFQN